LNIGIIHGFVGGGGGTEKTLLSILEALENTNHKVTLYTFSKPKLIRKKFIVKSSIPISIPMFGLYQRAMESKLMLKAKNEDILIQASGGFVVPENTKQKIVIYCHSDFSSELEKTTTKYKGIWGKYYKKYYEKISKSLERIHQENILLISNSKYIQNSIEKIYKKKSYLLYPPLDLSEFNPNSPKKQSIITVSRFSPEKNLKFAIDVLKDIQTPSIIIGNTKTKSNLLYFNTQIELSKDIVDKRDYRVTGAKLEKFGFKAKKDILYAVKEFKSKILNDVKNYKQDKYSNYKSFFNSKSIQHKVYTQGPIFKK